MKNTTSITNILLAAVLVFLLLSNVASLGGVQAAQATSSSMQTSNVVQQACDTSRTLQVTGAALINVTPDRVMIQLGVQSNGVTVDEVKIANSNAIQDVMRALQTQGIPENNISTDVYVIEPVYETYNSLYIKGYRINNIVAVTLKDVRLTSAVVAAALEAGANQVIDVQFYTSELRKYRDLARELAVKAAQEKAQALASAAGAETGCVLHINENSWSYYNGWWYGRSQDLWTQNTVQNAVPGGGTGSSAGDEPISLGQISVKAEVSVSYSLK